jgi:hypothetical protein
MPLPEPWAQQLEQIGDPAELPREKELGELNFANTAGEIKQVIRLLTALAEEPWDELAETTKNDVWQQLNTLTAAAGGIRAFSLTQDNAINQHTALKNQVHGVAEWFRLNVRPHLRAHVIEVSGQSAELAQAVEEARRATSEIEEMLTRLRRSVGEAGASRLSAYYNAQASDHRRQATAYLKWSAAPIAMLVLVAVILFVYIPPDVDTAASSTTQWVELVRALFIRLLLIGLATFALNFVARNYRINKHLQVVNEQKRNALDTFGLFAEAAPTEEARDVVVAELVRAVFSASETGFLAESGDRTVVESQSALLGLLASKAQGPRAQ